MTFSTRRKPLGHPTGAQVRAARGLLNMSVLDLAERTGLAVNTIKRAESVNTSAPINAANAKLLVVTLTAAGVAFIPPEDGFGAGVRLVDDAQPTLSRKRRSTPQGEAD